jgi:hypothetical protein
LPPRARTIRAMPVPLSTLVLLFCGCVSLPWHNPSNGELRRATCVEAPGVRYFGDLRAAGDTTTSRLVIVDGSRHPPRPTGKAYLMDSRGGIQVGTWRAPEPDSLHVEVWAIGLSSIIDGRWAGETLTGTGLRIDGWSGPDSSRSAPDSSRWSVGAERKPCPATATRPGKAAS